MQIVTPADYSKACVNVPDEFVEPRCFPIGKGGDDTLFGEFKIYDGLSDIDNDGMPDDWEIRYGLNPSDPSDAGKDLDRDGLTNLREYNLGSNPIEARDPGTSSIDVGLTQSDCRAVFTNDINFIGKSAAIPQYKFGDRIEIDSTNLIKITRPESGVQIRVDITGEDNNYKQTLRFNAHDIEKGAKFVVLDIPTSRVGADSPDNGLYNFKFSLIKNAALSDPLCGDENGRTSNSIKDKKVVIYDYGFSGCADSGGYDLSRQQSCISGNGNVEVYVDECSGEKLIEYSCNEQSQCISQIVSCPGEGVCQEGRCVLRREIVAPAPVTPVTTIPEITPALPAVIPHTGPTTTIPENQIKNGVETTKKNLDSYAVWAYIKTQSDDARVDFRLILAMITVESQGDQNAVSKDKKGNPLAYGVMQIVPSQHTSYDATRLKTDVRYNIQSGIKILKTNYDFAHTLSGNLYRDAIIKYCKEPVAQSKFLGYTGWNRALRLYIGAACGPQYDDNYVEKVNTYYERWKVEPIPIPPA